VNSAPLGRNGSQFPEARHVDALEMLAMQLHFADQIGRLGLWNYQLIEEREVLLRQGLSGEARLDEGPALRSHLAAK
jgi:hypothetical protein